MSMIEAIDAWTQRAAAFGSKKPPSKASAKVSPHQGTSSPKKRRGRAAGFDTVDHDQLAMFLSLQACKRAGRDNNAAILKAVREQAAIMIKEHGAFDGPRPQISLVDQEASDIEAIRGAPKGYELWVNGAAQVLTVIAKSLRDDIGADDIGLTAEAIGMVNSPRQMLGEIVLLLMSQNTAVGSAMKPWARTIKANIKDVKGARLGRSAKDVFPDPRRLKMTTYDMAHDVFRDTPFLAMLTVHVPVPISKQIRTEHMNFVAPSGTGKTQLLQAMLTHDLPDIRAGKASAVVFDTDGTLSHKIMLHAASDPKLADRVVYIDPANPDLRPNINLLNLGPKGGGNELVKYVIEALGEGFTDRQATFFEKVAAALSRIPNPNLDTLIKFLSREDFGQRYLGEFPPNLAEFVSDRLFGGQYTSTREQVVDRVSSLRDVEGIGGMFDADVTDLKTSGILDHGSLFIIRINKDSTDQGGLGSYAKLACRFYLASIVMAIQSRKAHVDNMPTWLYLDEIADMIGGGSDQFLVQFLIQARKKNAGAILAYQILDQLKGVLRSAALGNTSIKIAGKVEKSDREALAGNMDCSSALFGQIRKTKTHGQVACVVNGLIDQAGLCRFPFLVLERMPQGSNAQLDDLFDQQKLKWASRAAENKRGPVRSYDEDVVPMTPRTKTKKGFDEW